MLEIYTIIEYIARIRRDKIIRLINREGGDVRAAIRYMTTRFASDSEDDDTPAECLGSFISCNPETMLAILCRGSAASNPILAWKQENFARGRPPDFIVYWKDVFEYVATGKHTPKQIKLF